MTADHDTPKTVVVTGAARGIGAAIAARFHSEGMNVAVLDISPDVERKFADTGDERVIGIRTDVSDEASVGAAFVRLRQQFGPVSVLVNNAALTSVHRDWRAVGVADWDRVMTTNLRSAFLCTRAAVDDMIASSWGRIVNIGSVTFLSGQRHLIDYVSSKGGIVGFTRSLAREVGEFGVTVNTVSPGSILTEADLENFPDQSAIDAEQMKVQAIQRRGRPDDVAAAVSFLASAEAGFISGQMLNVDGGWLLH